MILQKRSSYPNQTWVDLAPEVKHLNDDTRANIQRKKDPNTETNLKIEREVPNPGNVHTQVLLVVVQMLPVNL